MADDQVLEQRLKLGRKVGNQGQLRLQHLQLDDHVPQKLAARGVGERAVVGQFVNLADVVQENAGQQQISIHLRIVSGDQVAGAKERDHVIEQSADIGVVQRFGGGSVAVGRGDVGIRHEGAHQGLKMRILE